MKNEAPMKMMRIMVIPRAKTNGDKKNNRMETKKTRTGDKKNKRMETKKIANFFCLQLFFLSPSRLDPDLETKKTTGDKKN